MSGLPDLLERLPLDVRDIFVSAYAYAFEHGESEDGSNNIAWDAVFSVYVRQPDGKWGLEKGWTEGL